MNEGVVILRETYSVLKDPHIDQLLLPGSFLFAAYVL